MVTGTRSGIGKRSSGSVGAFMRLAVYPLRCGTKSARSAACAGRDIGLDRLGKRQHHLRPGLRRAEHRLIVDIAEVARFEQDRRPAGASKNVKGGKAMRLWPK